MQRNTILVVEDDALLRADTMWVLEEVGLAVVEKSDADEALGFLIEHSTDVAAVFTDIHLPGHSDGVHLAEVISRHWPHIGVIVTSADRAPDRDLPDHVQFMPKPWRADDIVHAMQQILEAA